MKTREGDLVETSEGLIFDVKGLIHPPSRVVAFIRFFPDEKGERKKSGSTYGKVYSFSERYELLKERCPEYFVYDAVFDETLCEVPRDDIRKRYDPVEGLAKLRDCKNLDVLQGKALRLTEVLRERTNTPWSAIGISGSILTGLHRTRSDIDQVVYGSASCRRVHSALRRMLKEPQSLFKPYSSDELKDLFDFRSKDTAMDFRDFVRTESKKAFQGKFMGTDYFFRFVKDWSEIHEEYGDIRYKNVGYAKIKATIADDSESIFTPCRYALENATVVDGPKLSSIEEIASFRGRFCDQAKNGHTVIAQGKVESVRDLRQDRSYLRLLIGNKPSDYMILY